MLNFYRAMLAFRKAHAVLRKGTLEIVTAEDTVLTFLREDAGAGMFCAFNLGESEISVTLPEGDWKLETGTPFTPEMTGSEVRLPPCQAAFAVRQDA